MHSRFKFGAYYGITAPILLSLSKSNIDLLFSYALKSVALSLVENLKIECLALKYIFDQNVQKTPDDPHVALMIDEESAKTQAFIRGFNKLKQQTANAGTAPSLADEAVTKTDLFSDSFDLGIDMDIQDSRTVPDILSLGSDKTVDASEFPSVKKIQQFMLHGGKKLFDADTYSEIKKQLSELPRKPSDIKVDYSSPVSVSAYKVLCYLYKQMTTTVNNVTKIDYIIDMLTSCSRQSDAKTCRMLGYSAVSFSTELSVGNTNYKLNTVLSRIASVSDESIKSELISKFIADCDSLLCSEKFSASELIGAIATNGSDVDFVYEQLLTVPVFVNSYLVNLPDVIKQLIRILISCNKLESHLWNFDDFLCLCYIFTVVHDVDSQCFAEIPGLYATSLQLSDKKDYVNEVGIELAKVYRVAGFSSATMQLFDRTLRIVDSLTFRCSIHVENQGRTENSYRMIKLLKQHLLSLQCRRK